VVWVLKLEVMSGREPGKYLLGLSSVTIAGLSSLGMYVYNIFATFFVGKKRKRLRGRLYIKVE